MEQQSILIVAGEASGDEHAAGLIRQVQLSHPDLDLHWYGSGGEKMASLGVELVADASQLGAIGPWAAMANLPAYWRLYRGLQERARRERPRLAVLVDFPEFNLRLARKLKRLGVPVCYFISPQIWAWRPSRVRKVRRWVDRMLVILPFEEEFYRSRGVAARYVGNPTSHRLGLAPARPPEPEAPPTVALLPGSRRKEIEQLFPLQLETAVRLQRICGAQGCPEPRFRVVEAPSVQRGTLRQASRRWSRKAGAELPVEIARGEIREALAGVDFALVKSGTSTLEAMLLQVPFAMIYRMSPLSWHFARLLVDIDMYCLANIVAGERIVREFVQHDADPGRMAEHAFGFLEDRRRGGQLRQRLARAARRLGTEDAYLQAAKEVGQWIKREKEAA